MKRRMLVALTTAVIVGLFASAGFPDSPESGTMIGPDAVWNDSEQFAEKVASTCGELRLPKSQQCLIKMFEREHAPAAAKFTRRIQGEGYMRAFRKVGPVDIAYVTYPFRANENNGILLVNGSPAIINVDDFKALPQKDLKKDPSYKALLASFPDAMLFMGERFSTDVPTVEQLSDGGISFIVPYRLNNVCRACERLAIVSFGFDFDATGTFLRIRYVGLRPEEKGGRESGGTPK
jgi:hypothetical protein